MSMGDVIAQWLRCCPTTWKVVSSNLAPAGPMGKLYKMRSNVSCFGSVFLPNGVNENGLFWGFFWNFAFLFLLRSLCLYWDIVLSVAVLKGSCPGPWWSVYSVSLSGNKGAGICYSDWNTYDHNSSFQLEWGMSLDHKEHKVFIKDVTVHRMIHLFQGLIQSLLLKRK